MTSQASEEPSAPVGFASRSDVGQVRTANEDSCDDFQRSDGTRLLVVADGMGGHQGGATASRMAVEIIAETFDRGDGPDERAMIEHAIREANSRIYEMAQADHELEGMGTTVVAFLLDPQNRGTVGHVGDSRAYRYRRGRLEPLTTDHSVVAEMHRRGLISAEEADVHPRRNEILRSVGVLPEVEVEVAGVDVAPGDRFVLCSDGLSGVVSDDEIAAIVQAETPASAVDRLVDLANERGGPDNITVQILAIPADATIGDPEATAPVELSEVGIQAIEIKRKARIRARRIGLAVAIVGLALAGYLLLQSLGRSNSPRPDVSEAQGEREPPESEPSLAVPKVGETPPAPRDIAPPPSEENTPRRGVPR